MPLGAIRFPLVSVRLCVPTTDALPVSGSKGWHAHALGASGAMETAISCLAMTRGWIHPTLNCIDPDPAGDLLHVPPEGLERRPRAVLKNSFGFGGCNATLLLRDPGV